MTGSGFYPTTEIKRKLWKEMLGLITEWANKQPTPLQLTQKFSKVDGWEITSWGRTEVHLTCLPCDGGTRRYFTVKLTEHHT